MKKVSEVEIPIVVKVSIEVNIVSVNEEKENTTTENNGVDQMKSLKSVLTNSNFGIIC